MSARPTDNSLRMAHALINPYVLPMRQGIQVGGVTLAEAIAFEFDVIRRQNIQKITELTEELAGFEKIAKNCVAALRVITRNTDPATYEKVELPPTVVTMIFSVLSSAEDLFPSTPGAPHETR